MNELLDKILGLLATLKASCKPSQKKPKNIGKVAICVGHSRIGDKGARSVGGVSEWTYNSKVAKLLAKQLEHRGISSVVIDDYPSKSYTGAMKWVAEEISKHKADIAIELHFNSSSSSSAEGYEYLYYAHSAQGKRLALCLQREHQSKVTSQKDRGAQPLERGARGGQFLVRVGPPAVICEPFFGSNPKEWVLLGQNPAIFADIYATGIYNYFNH